MAAQQQTLRNVSPVATSAGVWTTIGGGSLNANVGDNNVATGIKSTKPASIKHPNQDLAAIPAGALIDYVQLHLVWKTAASTKFHYAAWVEVSGKEYANNFIYGGAPAGHAGDTWVGDQSAQATRFGAIHPLAPQDLGLWTSALVNGLYVRHQVYNDSDVDIQLLESMVDVYYYRKPTTAISGITGPDSAASGRKITWVMTGDNAQTQCEVWLVTQAQVDNGWAPGDDGSLWHFVGFGGTTLQLPDFSDDGNYVVFVRTGFALPQSRQSMWSDYVSATMTVSRAPNAPVLVSPADGGYFDVAAGFTGEWQFSSPAPSATQSAWAFGRTAASVGTEEYWDNGAKAWGGVLVWNGDSAQSVFFDPGLWSDGETYTWRVKTQDQNAAISPWSTPRTLIGNAPPSVQVAAPTGTVTLSSTPIVNLVYGDAEDDPQDQVEVKVFTQDVYGLDTFDPGSATPVWTTGALATTVDDFIIATPLDNGQTYRCYARVHNIGGWSDWAFSEFTMGVTGPTAPTLVVTPDDKNSRVRIDIFGHDNLANAQDSDFEDATAGVGNWSATGATLTQTDEDANNGNNCMKAVTTVTGSEVIIRMTSGGSLYMKVTPLALYTAMAWVRAKTAADKLPMQIWLRFWDINKNILPPGYDAISASVTTDDTNWTQYKVTGVAPPSAAYCNIRLYYPAGTAVTGKTAYIDMAGVMYGDADDWGEGGFDGLTKFYVERSDDHGASWNAIRNGDNIKASDAQRARVYDYEPLAYRQCQYRARSYVELDA